MLAGFALPHLKKTCRQIGTRHGIVRTQGKGVAEQVNCGSVLAIEQQDSSKLRQNIRSSRRGVPSGPQQRAGLCAVIVLETQASQVEFQIDAFRHQREACFDGGYGFIKTSGFRKLTCEFLEGRQKGWMPGGDAPELLDAIG